MTAPAQFVLFDIEPVKVKGPLSVKFEAFHRANPHVLDAIIRTAHELRNRGVERAGMKLIFERLRWLYTIQTKGDDYRLNNNWTAYYARLVPLVEPSLVGMFSVRVQADEWTPDLAELGLAAEPWWDGS